MNILWVKVGGLWPLNIGGRLRSFHILSELSKRHRVTVFTTGDDSNVLAKALPHCVRVVSFDHNAPKAGSAGFAAALARSWFSPSPVDLAKWRVPALRAAVEQMFESGQVDVCIADFLHATANVPMHGPVPVVLFEHNVEWMIWKRLAEKESRPLRRALLEVEWRKMRRRERDACRLSRAVIAVSPSDAACLGAQQSIPTGVDTSYFTANGTPESPAHLVFSGAMDWYPNEDAMLHFIAEILPAVRREVPNVTVTVVGRNPSDRLRDAGEAAGVHITGTVDDVRPYVDAGSVYIVPLRIGGGTRLKIFEALSMGKAVISTTIGAEGLPLVDGRHFVCADSPDDFARAVVALLRDPGLRKRLGNAGRELVRENYSWPSVAREFELALQS